MYDDVVKEIIKGQEKELWRVIRESTRTRVDRGRKERRLGMTPEACGRHEEEYRSFRQL